MIIHISDEYAHDIIVTKLQDDWLDINDDIRVIEAMNRAGETHISLEKFYLVRDSIKNVLRYHMEEDLFQEWEDEINHD
jgi:uncharacterized protein YlzI (FlbEa/FlbD family)